MKYTYTHTFSLADFKGYMKILGTNDDARLNDCLLNAIDVLAKNYSICTCDTTIEAFIYDAEYKCRLGNISTATASGVNGEIIDCAFFGDRIQIASIPAKVTMEVTETTMSAPSVLVFALAGAMFDGVTDSDSWSTLINQLTAPYAKI